MLTGATCLAALMAAPGLPAWAGEATSTTERRAASRATATTPADNIFSSLAVTLGFDPDAGAAEAICPGAGPIEHVEDFRGTAAFPRATVAELQRATVRLSVQPAAQLDRTMKEDLGLRPVTLGAFTGFEAWGRGVCTGTLITRNIVLTAGHCISPRFWQEEQGVAVPKVAGRGGEPRYIRAQELARLMQVEFNYQNRYLADLGAFQPPSARDDLFSARVTELISADYRNPQSDSAVDYALLRIETVSPAARERLEATALGLGRLQLDPPASSRQPIAVVQHPAGFEKKIATGSILNRQAWRLYYKDLSTEGGSSGAPVFSSRGRIVAIHTRGGCASAAGGFANKAMSLHGLKDVIAALRDPS